MSAQRSNNPLTLNTRSYTDSKGGVVTAAATFRYDESSNPPRRRSSATQRPSSRQAGSIGSVASPRRQQQQQPQQRRHQQQPSGSSSNAMATYTNTTATYTNGTASLPQAMFVEALYDYEADDRTSLSFRKGDIIQVITQLESGWWDGIHGNIRGWFPSNYCVVINQEDGHGDAGVQSADEGESSADDNYEDPRVVAANRRGAVRSQQLREMQDSVDDEGEEEAAFWIPSVTADGRLFYYNTLTGVSSMELPLRAPTSLNETGPRERANVNAPDYIRPPPEMMAGGYERDEDETSASEAEDTMGNSRRRRRTSYISDGVSPAGSMESLSNSPVTRSRAGTREFYRPSNAQTAGGMTVPGVSVPSFTGNLLGQYSAAQVPRSFYDDGSRPPLTWNRLVENMRKSVEAYRQAIENADRAEYVRRAEDISDHLRMLLAAGSGTTDNHSGNPSVISTNKALYPHFRDMMSRFSKLVLSSHIAAADWPAPDSYSKCLQEAEGVLQGVYGYVEIARAQRGEEIPRLIPGFILGNESGGNWQTNNLSAPDTLASSSFMDQDELDSNSQPSTPLDRALLSRMDEMQSSISTSLLRLDEQLVLSEKVVSPARHEQLSNSVCSAAIKVVEAVRSCISLVESVNLATLGDAAQGQQLADFATHKQNLYDLTGALVVACQSVGGSLSDEWSDIRGESLEGRMQEIRSVSQQLENAISQAHASLQDLVQAQLSVRTHRESHRRNDHSKDFSSRHMRNASSKGRSGHAESPSFDGGIDPLTDTFRDKPKLMNFFGVSVQEETPDFLRLDYENEIAWEKTEPPQLKGGTLTALVEQLTRHDRLETNFNNTFLLTYRSFTTASELFEMLVRRFTIQPPRSISQDNYRTWVDKKQKPIRFRVVNILKSWFDNYWMEGKDEASMDLLRRVYSFAKDSVATSNTPGTGPLISVIEQRLKGADPTPKRLVPNMNGQAPVPIVPKNMKKLKFMDIDPTEFARQLTIIEYSLYGKIKPTECLSKTWQKKIITDEDDPAPNVKALILHSNQLTNWVAEMILAQNDVKRRGFVIKHFVSVAEKCRQLNNFSTMTSIISALSTAPIHRLNRTWAQVNARTSSTLETMRRLMSSTKNFGEYRECLHSANPPCIPFFGVYLTDLTFIEDGIPSIIKKTDLINFAKRTKTAEVIRDIQQYQNVPYPLTPVKELQEYILNNMQAAGDVHEMYDRSLVVEPREREDEKIARLLSESGFL